MTYRISYFKSISVSKENKIKHAILILAHQEFDILKKMINFFNNDFFLYIHIDKKSSVSEDDLHTIKNAKNVLFLSRKYNINWAGHNTLKAILMLAEETIKNKDIDYIHLISGQDFPVKSCDHIQRIMQTNKGREFINYFKMPAPFWIGDGGLDRIAYYNLYNLFNARTYVGRKTINFLLGTQKVLRIKRDIQESSSKFYGGSSWWSLSYACLSYIINFTKSEPDYLKKFEYSFAAEEIFFQTIIMNSPFRHNAINNNLRYIDWEYKNGSRPAVLDANDYNSLVDSDAIFARKFQYPISKELINRIECDLMKKKEKLSQQSYLIFSRGKTPLMQ